jgi:DNA-binding NarL/FixJ family response regulator
MMAAGAVRAALLCDHQDRASAPLHAGCGGAADPACGEVYDRLSQRQRAVLRAFAEGLRPDEVAAALHITLSTVNSHKSAILAECRVAWALAEDAPLDYRFVRERFAGATHLWERV